jgi:hypothetical protein
MALAIQDCEASPTRITVIFSEVVDAADAETAGKYTISQMSGSGIATSASLAGAASIAYDSSRNAARITPSIPGTTLPNSWPWSLLTPGVWIAVQFQETAGAPAISFPTLVDGGGDPVRDAQRSTRAAEDAVAYPLLTEEVGYAPSPLAGTSGGPPSGGRGAASLGQTVTQAVSDVLGWKIKPDDPKAFVGALTASFTCTDFEGHTQCAWTPRTYAVQTDLSGGITGAQASIYSRAQDAVNQSLPLLDGLYPLDPEADSEDIAALKGVARSQLTELVNELGLAGGPRIERVNQYFQLLLQDPGTTFPPATPFITDPDEIRGTLGSLRDVLGVNFQTQDFVNTVQDEQDLSNFRILSDYVTSLAQSWINNLPFFGLTTATPFFGTQLVLLSRQLGVVAEAVDEVRFTLDSVFIGPAERQTLQLQFNSGAAPLFAEDLFNWVQSFATDEGPRLIQDGGKYGVQFSFLPIAQQLQGLIRGAQDPNSANRGLPPGWHTFRVQRALKQLGDELTELVNLASPISHKIEEEPSPATLDALRDAVATLTFQIQNQHQQLPGPAALVPIPPQLIFPLQQQVRTVSPPQVLTLFNAGSGSVTITNIEVGPDTTNPSAQGDFAIVEPQPDQNGVVSSSILLAPQTTLAVSVAFTPSAANSRTANLNVTYNGATTTPPPLLSIPLQGTGAEN